MLATTKQLLLDLIEKEAKARDSIFEKYFSHFSRDSDQQERKNQQILLLNEILVDYADRKTKVSLTYKKSNIVCSQLI